MRDTLYYLSLFRASKKLVMETGLARAVYNVRENGTANDDVRAAAAKLLQRWRQEDEKAKPTEAATHERKKRKQTDADQTHVGQGKLRRRI